MIEIISAAPRICSTLRRVGNDLYLYIVGDLFECIIHSLVADHVWGLQHNILFTLLHQRCQGIQKHRLLIPRSAITT